MLTYTIEQIETAINIHRTRQPADANHPTLCDAARLLAVPYTMMFLEKRDSISLEELSPQERDALLDALHGIMRGA